MAKALVLYHSQEFGNTGAMAEAVAEGLRTAGYETTLFNTDEGRYDVTQFPQYDCVAFGSPDYFSYIAGGLKTFMDDHYVHDVRKDIVDKIQNYPYQILFHKDINNSVNAFYPLLENRFKEYSLEVRQKIIKHMDKIEGNIREIERIFNLGAKGSNRKVLQ